VEFVGVVPNSLQDIGRASDEAKQRLVGGGLGRSVAESEVGRSGCAPMYTWGYGGRGGAPRGTVCMPLLGFRGDLILL
jgi:hypothetical protein